MKVLICYYSTYGNGSKAATRTNGKETVPAGKEQCTHVRDINLFHRPELVALGNPVRWSTTPLRDRRNQSRR